MGDVPVVEHWGAEWQPDYQRFAEVDGRVYLCFETLRGWRCGKCLRGVFRGVPLHPGECRVCGAEHWVGRIAEFVMGTRWTLPRPKEEEDAT